MDIVLGVVVMIFLHELGHFVTAKWSGMKVTEFFIGFGPASGRSPRRPPTGSRSSSAVSYVRIVGMNNLDEADLADEPRNHRQQSFPKRLLVVSAGSIMHLLQAFVLLVVLLGVVGVPGGTPTGDVTPVAWDVSEITPDSAAEDAGLRDGDRIVAVDGEQASSSFDNLSEALAGHEVGDEVDFTIERDGETQTVPAELQPRPEGKQAAKASPFLGVKSSVDYLTERTGAGSAIVSAPGEMVTFMREAVGAMAELFSPSGLGDFADNVSIAGEEAPERDTGGGAQGGVGRRRLRQPAHLHLRRRAPGRPAQRAGLRPWCWCCSSASTSSSPSSTWCRCYRSTAGMSASARGAAGATTPTWPSCCR